MAQQKYTEKKKASNRKWDAANLDRLSIALPRGSREEIKAYAATHGESVNAFISRAIEETMARGGPAQRQPGAPAKSGTAQTGSAEAPATAMSAGGSPLEAGQTTPPAEQA